MGRTRRIDTGFLWTQQTAAEKRLQYSNVGHCKMLSVHFAKCRAEAAPAPSSMPEGKAAWEMESDSVHADRQQINGHEEDMGPER